MAIFWSCNDSRKYPLSIAIKDRGVYPKLLRGFEESGNIKKPDSITYFMTPTIQIDSLERATISYQTIKGTRVEWDEYTAFTMVVTDQNSNGLFDNGDFIDFSGYGEDSVLLSYSLLKIRGKNPVYLGYNDHVLKILIDRSMQYISVSRMPEFDYIDMNFPAQIPSLTVQDLQTGRSTNLASYKQKDLPLLILRTGAYCKPCIQNFEQYIAHYDNLPEAARKATKVFFFPENTDATNILKYTQNLTDRHNFRFVKGDLNQFSDQYGLLMLPDGVLYDPNGVFMRNHFLLPNFRQDLNW